MMVVDLDFCPHVVWPHEKGFCAFGPMRTISDQKFMYFHHNQEQYPISLDIDNDNGFFPHSYCRFFNVVQHKTYVDLLFNYGFLKFKFQKSTTHCFGIHKAWTQFTKDFKQYKPNFHLPLSMTNFHQIGNNMVAIRHDYLWCNNNFIKLKNRAFNDVKISPDLQTLATAVGGDIEFRDLNTLEIKYTIKTRRRSVNHLAYSLDGLTLAAVTSAQKLLIWDVD
jgi:WD40 repeat protein